MAEAEAEAGVDAGTTAGWGSGFCLWDVPVLFLGGDAGAATAAGAEGGLVFGTNDEVADDVVEGEATMTDEAAAPPPPLVLEDGWDGAACVGKG